MKSLLVLASHPQFPEEVRRALDLDEVRIIHRLTVEEAEPILAHHIATTCVIDIQSAGVQGVWTIERILRRAPGCSIVVFAETRDPEWEEELYAAGAAYVFNKPIRGRLLATAVQNLWKRHPEPRPAEMAPMPSGPVHVARETVPVVATDQLDRRLGAMHRLSEILNHSLDAKALFDQFLGLLRETMGINRSAIFLTPASIDPAGLQHPGDSSWMKPVCSTGVPPALIEQLTLSPEAGIGGWLSRTGRILKRHGPEDLDADTRHELEMIGAEFAVPIMGRDEMIGVALLDRRVTGQIFQNNELESMFHLFEQVGKAVTNIRIHGRLVGSNQLLGDVLKELNNACLVVGPDLTVRHVNKAARRLIGGAGRRAGTLDFGDIPEQLGSRIYQVIKTGAAVPAFRYETETGAKSIYNVSVVPIRSSMDAASVQHGTSALMVVEDRTQLEQLKELEVEAANLRLVSNMADRLAAEIGNAIVPLSVHFQLYDDRIKEAEFRKSLKSVLSDAVKRVGRLASQMRFIYGNPNAGKVEVVSLGKLLDTANTEAKGYFSSKSAALDSSADIGEVSLSGNPNALAHSFSEIILNGYQACSGDAQVRVRMIPSSRSNGVHEIGIEFEDSGQGFTPEASKRAVTPFFTTKTAGVGLGLSAASKIIEDHGGRLEIPVNSDQKHGVVRVFLPAEPVGE